MNTPNSLLTPSELKRVNAAKRIIMRAMQRQCADGVAEGTALTSPNSTRDYLMLHMGALKREVFHVVFLNSQHVVVGAEDMFFGTVDGAAVYPREVARRCVELGAAAIVLAHNHPSGNPEPSNADRRITERLVAAMALIDVRVLDHVIVAGTRYKSFAEEGLI